MPWSRSCAALPDLQRFQVLLFSDQLQYLMGSDGVWLEFDAQKSADAVYRAINLVKPKGSTNMHAAMVEAFRFRSMGLDTIYLLSDGLPNDGPGLTAEQANSLKENDREVVLRALPAQRNASHLESGNSRAAQSEDQHGRLFLRKPGRRRLPLGAGPRKRRRVRGDEQALGANKRDRSNFAIGSSRLAEPEGEIRPVPFICPRG